MHRKDIAFNAKEIHAKFNREDRKGRCIGRDCAVCRQVISDKKVHNKNVCGYPRLLFVAETEEEVIQNFQLGIMRAE